MLGSAGFTSPCNIHHRNTDIRVTQPACKRAAHRLVKHISAWQFSHQHAFAGPADLIIAGIKHQVLAHAQL